MGITASQLLSLARSQIGTLENPLYSNRVKYNTDLVNWGYYPASWGMDMQWCAGFCSWLFITLKAAGFGVSNPIFPVHVYTPDGYNWFQSRGLRVAQNAIRPGDIMYVSYASQSAPVGHIGIVDTVIGNGQVQTVEGNSNTDGSSNGYGVFYVRRTLNSRLYFFRPKYDFEASSGEMKINDVVGKDATGKEYTVAQGLARGDSAYWSTKQDANHKGWFVSRMDDELNKRPRFDQVVIQKDENTDKPVRLDQIIARANSGYHAPFAYGWVGKRLADIWKAIEELREILKEIKK